MLADMRRFFGKRVEDAGARFAALPLFLSFRSTREVLNAVDAVFTSERSELITASGYEAHASHRDREPGHVVVMPRIVRTKPDEPEDWTTPFDAPSAAETDLAQRIADEIATIRGTVLPSGKRLRDGEILVLVRKRDAFAAAMNRALRARGIPTAGADRIPLATHIAVLDLLALADVMLLPEDDLQLAACLKSPLLGIGEDALMHVAAHRDHKSLWSALQASDDLTIRAAADRLVRWRGMADRVTPFRFFAAVLGPEGGRRAFRARLGGEADDILDAFLSQALAYEALEPPSLQGFTRFVRANESDIKRESDGSATGVRIMTVHGAKGLEADVVFLVDTGGLIAVPGQRDKLVAIGAGRDDPAFLWRRLTEQAPQCQRDADSAADAETEREYLRLLYVAMTRPRDVLYVAGIRGPKTPQDCWYSLVAKALVPAGAERDPETGELAAAYQWPQPQRTPLDATPAGSAAPDVSPVAPDWLRRAVPTPAPAPQPLRPSRALGDPDPQLGREAALALEAAQQAAALRGRIIHKLLHLLPAMAETERPSAALRLVQQELPDDPALAADMIAEASAVLAEPSLRDVFGRESRAEVAIVGRLATERGEHAVRGRIDRLVCEANGWQIVDFKTNRAVPATLDDADPAYVLQLALYRRLLQAMQPGQRVRAALVWTAEPKIMPVTEASMERALAALGVRAIAVP
jgi:ATP-dependent helicase/nuclease subunit A